MEAVAAPYSAEHHRQSLSVSPYRNKQRVRSARNRGHISAHLSTVPRPSENFDPMNNVGRGLLSSNSYNNRSSPFTNQSSKQPPLLPLPVIPMVHISSYPPTNSAKPRPQRSGRHNSVNPSKPQMRRQGSIAVTRSGSDNKVAGAIMPGAGPLGPNPDELPKNISISKVPNPSPLLTPLESSMFSGSVFELAPPPSSLPLPKFSLRPKFGCNTERGG